MLVNACLDILGDTGVKALVRTFDYIDVPHCSIVSYRRSYRYCFCAAGPYNAAGAARKLSRIR